VIALLQTVGQPKAVLPALLVACGKVRRPVRPLLGDTLQFCMVVLVEHTRGPCCSASKLTGAVLRRPQSPAAWSSSCTGTARTCCTSCCVWTCAGPALSQSRLASPPRQPLASPWDHKPRLQYLAAWQARLHRAPLAGQASGSSFGRPGIRQLFAARQEPGQAPQYARSWVDELNARGYSVCGVDQQGLGYSEGVRGYVERFADYVTDVLQFAKCASWLPAPAACWQLLGVAHGQMQPACALQILCLWLGSG